MEKFNRWLDSWKQNSVTQDMEASFSDFMNGRISELKDGIVTVSKVTDDKTRPPYHHYTKYNVLKESQVD